MRDILLVYILLWGFQWAGGYLKGMLDDSFTKLREVIVWSLIFPAIYTFIIFKMFAK